VLGYPEAVDYLDNKFNESLVQTFERVHPEEVAEIRAEVAAETPCGATRDGLVCSKAKHRGRHAYRPRPHRAPYRSWVGVGSQPGAA